MCSSKITTITYKEARDLQFCVDAVIAKIARESVARMDQSLQNAVTVWGWEAEHLERHRNMGRRG